ncbi:YybH family protein [Nonomuraea rhodomycinica]|uniref:SgcJ/EcaC family oxidoreductase n=1 Tax=Nonomuraea rhodomycinica TaxID=1712872 RepID=A0A7Y6MEE5_9ACTN|nr:SgcJ/EcaC family oxidoreductase [Nonomuraea rhodomycinica]NUW43624.1 SgcJ/EcaC family oxidoreductase [Nonomuraea rhodomycinica]
MEFAKALDAHLAAIHARDLEGYLATVHQDASLILPNGTLLRGKEAIAEFHAAWFADTDWSMRAEPVRVEAAGEAAFALLSVVYDDLDPKGEPYRKTYYLTLYFTRADERWLLVHDQNTYR